ncbi:ABC transporter permease subunit [Streptomyces phaeochromogenes]|uniref:ABC transporter permease subunit n=1 Tax=Streptomyces phaeochromogenes TaxID=1923 RepID=UPI002DDA53A6|nr:ATP-binding cassette domain-containing protein [Streptomyces phaeochromogenes]WRZ34501.1 ATP-binding cassette domain-containing protein [Streptomyces phaeochromogenes]
MFQAILGGLVAGAIYALLGIGIATAFRVSKVVNLAQGNFFVLGIMVAASLAGPLPLPVAVLGAVLVCAGAGALQYRFVIRPALSASHATQLLVTLGSGLALSGAVRVIWGPDDRSLAAMFEGTTRIWDGRLTYQGIAVIVVAVLLTAALTLFLHRTDAGLAMRTIADSPSSASSLGINVARTSTTAFALSAGLAGLAGVLIAPLLFVNFSSGLLMTVYGFVAASFGGLSSLSLTLAGGLALGCLEAIAAHQFDSALKTPLAMTLFLAIVLVRNRGGLIQQARVIKRIVSWRASGRGRPSFKASAAALPARKVSWRRGSAVTAAAIALAAPFGAQFIDPYWLSVLSFLGVFVIVGLGLDLLLGYTGLLSLGQTAFMGLGAYLVALTPKWWGLGPWAAIAVAVLISCLVAAVVGTLVLGLRGYYFALATLVLAITAELVANGSPGLLGGPSGVDVPGELKLFGISLDTPERLFLVIWVMVAAIAFLLSRTVTSRFGLGLDLVRSDPDLAAAAGVPADVLKLQAFVFSAGIAAVGGVLYAYLLRFVSPPAIGFEGGIDALVGLMLGGLGTVWGALVGVAVVRLLPEWTGSSDTYQLLIYGVLLTAIALVFPRGIVGTVGLWGRNVGRGRTAGPKRLPAPTSRQVQSAPTAPRSHDPRPLLEGRSLTKRFGGVTAADGIDIALVPGEVHGLIGPNGAGKSTTLALLSGRLRPTSGAVRFGGKDVTTLPAWDLASLGVVQTFQIPRFPADQTCWDVAAMGAFSQGSGGFLQGAGPRGARVVGMLYDIGLDCLERVGLLGQRDRLVSELSTGQQKLLELARALAARPRVLLADEPAGGLSADEHERLGVLLRSVAEQGTAVLLIEHSVPLVMNVCDRVTVLAEGRLVTSGRPREIRTNQEVIDAYLGT